MHKKFLWMLFVGCILSLVFFMGAYQPVCQKPPDGCGELGGEWYEVVRCAGMDISSDCTGRYYDACNCDADQVASYAQCPQSAKSRTVQSACICAWNNCFKDSTEGCFYTYPTASIVGMAVDGRVFRDSSKQEGLAGAKVTLRLVDEKNSQVNQKYQSVYSDDNGYFVFNFVDLSSFPNPSGYERMVLDLESNLYSDSYDEVHAVKNGFEHHYVEFPIPK